MNAAQQPMDERILARIRKTLALAGNNPSAAEAQTAMLKAQQLLVQHGLTMQDVTDGTPPEDGVRDRAATEYQRLAWWSNRLAGVIGRNFRCQAYIQRAKGRSQVCFIGLHQDVDVAVQVYAFARETMGMLWDVYRRERGLHTASRIAAARNEFMRGFLSGLEERFRRQVAENDWALVLVNHPLVDEAVANKRLRKSSPPRARRWGDPAAWQQGYEEGRQFDPDHRNSLRGD